MKTFSMRIIAMVLGCICISATPLAVSNATSLLNSPREAANRVQCASNLQQIGQAMVIYANQHQGQLPGKLGLLVKIPALSPYVFACPSTETTVPANLPPDQLADWVNANSDYVYIGAGLNAGKIRGNQNAVLLYDKAANHGNDGMNLLLGDFSVTWMDLDTANRAIARSKATFPGSN